MWRRQSWDRGAPVVEKLPDAVDGTELGVAMDGWDITKGARDDGDGVCDAVGRRDGGLREVGVAELDGVQEEGGIGDLVNDVKAAVVLGGVANVKSVAAAIIP